MALPANPISGGHELTNSPWVTHWSCPNCYEDITSGPERTAACSCGATLKLTIDYEPVCRATCIDPDAEGAN